MRGGVRGLVAACAGLALLVSSCTGTRETPTPAYLVVAEGSRIGIVASPLPSDALPETDAFEWLEAFERDLPGDVIDLAVARDLPTQIFVAYRDGGVDVVQRFAAGAIEEGEPETLQALGEPIEVGAIVEADGTLTTDSLCTRAIGTSSNGRWLALFHEPAACGLSVAGAAVLLLDLAVEPPGDVVVFPDVVSSEDAATPPLFVPSPGGSEPGAMLYLEEDGTLVRLSLPEDDEIETLRSVPVADVDPVGLGTGGLGLVVAEENVVHTFGTWTTGDPTTLGVDPDLAAVVDADSLPNTPAVLLGDDSLVVLAGLGLEEAPEEEELFLSGLADATVGPYGYGFLLAPNRILAVDLLTYVGTAVGDETRSLGSFALPNVGGSDLPIQDPVAIDWIFGAVPTADP